MWDTFNYALTEGWATENTFMIDLFFQIPCIPPVPKRPCS